jgi:hypothetical protein
VTIGGTAKASDRAHSAYVRNRWDGSSQSDLSGPEVGFHPPKRLGSLIAVSLISLALSAAIWMAVGFWPRLCEVKRYNPMLTAAAQ